MAEFALVRKDIETILIFGGASPSGPSNLIHELKTVGEHKKDIVFYYPDILETLNIKFV